VIAAGGSERTRLFVSTDAEVRAANLAESVETAKTSIFVSKGAKSSQEIVRAGCI
jgi:hypothetical protein